MNNQITQYSTGPTFIKNQASEKAVRDLFYGKLGQHFLGPRFILRENRYFNFTKLGPELPVVEVYFTGQ